MNDKKMKSRAKSGRLTQIKRRRSVKNSKYHKRRSQKGRSYRATYSTIPYVSAAYVPVVLNPDRFFETFRPTDKTLDGYTATQTFENDKRMAHMYVELWLTTMAYVHPHVDWRVFPAADGEIIKMWNTERETLAISKTREWTDIEESRKSIYEGDAKSHPIRNKLYDVLNYVYETSVEIYGKCKEMHRLCDFHPKSALDDHMRLLARAVGTENAVWCIDGTIQTKNNWSLATINTITDGVYNVTSNGKYRDVSAFYLRVKDVRPLLPNLKIQQLLDSKFRQYNPPKSGTSSAHPVSSGSRVGEEYQAQTENDSKSVPGEPTLVDYGTFEARTAPPPFDYTEIISPKVSDYLDVKQCVYNTRWRKAFLAVMVPEEEWSVYLKNGTTWRCVKLSRIDRMNYHIHNGPKNLTPVHRDAIKSFVPFIPEIDHEIHELLKAESTVKRRDDSPDGSGRERDSKIEDSECGTITPPAVFFYD